MANDFPCKCLMRFSVMENGMFQEQSIPEYLRFFVARSMDTNEKDVGPG